MDQAIEVAGEVFAFGNKPGVIAVEGFEVTRAQHCATVEEAAAAAAPTDVVHDPNKPHHVWFVGKEEVCHVGSYTTFADVMAAVKRVNLIVLVTGPVDEDRAHMYAMRL